MSDIHLDFGVSIGCAVYNGFKSLGDKKARGMRFQILPFGISYACMIFEVDWPAFISSTQA